MRVYRQRRIKKSSPLPKIFLSFVLIVAVSFCLAWVWHNTQQAVAADQRPPETSAPELREVSEGAAATAPTVASTSPTDGPQEPEQEPEAPDRPAVFDGAVPESAAVDPSYFDDAIFLGDSISTGIPLYHIADNAAVVAMTGIHVVNITTYECIDIGEEQRATILDAAKAYGERAKVYILLGGNSLGYEKDIFLAGYKEFLDAVKAQYPGAIIYLQSITPVIEGYQNDYIPDLSNDKIDEYNLEILALAKRENVYYLDIAAALKNEKGALPTEASPVDGLHFGPEYYVKWFDYLKTHTVEGNK